VSLEVHKATIRPVQEPRFTPPRVYGVVTDDEAGVKGVVVVQVTAKGPGFGLTHSVRRPA
jgi:hypothetical protein